jgi:hypothetical protein
MVIFGVPQTANIAASIVESRSRRAVDEIRSVLSTTRAWKASEMGLAGGEAGPFPALKWCGKKSQNTLHCVGCTCEICYILVYWPLPGRPLSAAAWPRPIAWVRAALDQPPPSDSPEPVASTELIFDDAHDPA